MKSIKKHKTTKTYKQIRQNSIGLEEFKKRFSKKELEEIEKEKRYYEIMMLLRNNREQKGLTQAELANRMNIPRTTITKIESGKRNVTVETLMNIADAIDKKLVIQFV